MDTGASLQLLHIYNLMGFDPATGRQIQNAWIDGMERLQRSCLDSVAQLTDFYGECLEEGYALQISCLQQLQQWNREPEGIRRVPEVGEQERASSSVDDLTRIQGLGKVLQQRLEAAGVVSFEQILGWSAADIERIESEVLGSRFVGRIDRDQWQAQAEQLIHAG